MKRFALLLGGTLLAAGCNSGEGPFVNNLVREAVAPNGNVQQVEMTKQGDNSYSGFATVRVANGQLTRFICTASRQGSSSTYEARCLQVIDQAVIDELKQNIRRSFTSQGVTVLRLELTPQGEDRVTGYADVREPSGAEGRLPCAGARDANGRIPVECRPPATPIPAGQRAEPPAQEGAQPAEPEEAPADEGGEGGQ
jgi:hypothetical protein